MKECYVAKQLSRNLRVRVIKFLLSNALIFGGLSLEDNEPMICKVQLEDLIL